MGLLVGTSGYSYKEWKGNFYPDRMAASDMLAYYAERLETVEINNTFYRLPKTSVLDTWSSQVPAAFRFVIKASRRITHLRRLKDAEEETTYLLTTLETLGERLGAVLFQLPPNLKKDLPRLQTFLDLLPPGTRAVFEFRHPTWFDDEVMTCLAERDCPLCVADTDEEPITEITATASWGYVRLRREDYTAADLDAWVSRLGGTSWETTYVFFKHEDAGAGPRLALDLRSRFAGAHS